MRAQCSIVSTYGNDEPLENLQGSNRALEACWPGMDAVLSSALGHDGPVEIVYSNVYPDLFCKSFSDLHRNIYSCRTAISQRAIHGNGLT
jgi:hypothetical protein